MISTTPKRHTKISCDTPHCEHTDFTAFQKYKESARHFRNKGWLVGVDSDMCPKCAQRATPPIKGNG